MLGWLPWLRNTLPRAECYLLGGTFQDGGDDNTEDPLHMMTSCPANISTNSRSSIFLTSLGGKDQFCGVIGTPLTGMLGVADTTVDILGCKVVKVGAPEENVGMKLKSEGDKTKTEPQVRKQGDDIHSLLVS